MSIKTKEFYTVICDGCAADAFGGEEIGGWNDPGFAWEMAEDMGYIEYDGGHYCIACFEYSDYDDETNEVKIKIRTNDPNRTITN